MLLIGLLIKSLTYLLMDYLDHHYHYCDHWYDHDEHFDEMRLIQLKVDEQMIMTMDERANH
jgi:hypothetical protein